jgi:hypothetical protein
MRSFGWGELLAPGVIGPADLGSMRCTTGPEPTLPSDSLPGHVSGGHNWTPPGSVAPVVDIMRNAPVAQSMAVAPWAFFCCMSGRSAGHATSSPVRFHALGTARESSCIASASARPRMVCHAGRQSPFPGRSAPSRAVPGGSAYRRQLPHAQARSCRAATMSRPCRPLKWRHHAWRWRMRPRRRHRPCRDQEMLQK